MTIYIFIIYQTPKIPN